MNAGAVITISEYQFTPATVTIKAGQSVEWKNDGNVAHTVTETTTPRTFASADINPGQSYTQTFDKPGTYNYVCSIHPDRMHGTHRGHRGWLIAGGVRPAGVGPHWTAMVSRPGDRGSALRRDRLEEGRDSTGKGAG